ncbi:transpeptidase family protein [Litoribacter alkaliphilus]|uniref:Transpeptidase family protein n=1 Tax=Litoribacter ruber TaxID=702568 RepID=A0AAP2CIL7_9BACT|nr:penicillin-binding protein [Litoribacter alkaliphilus]MBS9523946.1 transpeptidase family protein [Litoribacter alkaliphilus]
MNIKKSILLRIRFAFLVVAIFAGVIFYRITQIQFVEGEEWRKKSDEVNLQYRTVKATRGNIYSGDGSLLATSLPFYRVALDPSIAKDEVFRNGIDSLSIMLSKHYNDKSRDYYKRLISDARSNNKKYVLLNRKQIGYQEMQAMMKWPIFRNGRMGGGVIFEKVEKRFYPFKALAGRTVGFLNEDNYGAGLEYSFNAQLGGENGEALFQKIAGGTWKPVHDANDIKPEDGYDIVTTLDVNLQDVAESALLKQLMNKDAEFGSVIVMEVATGHIKAIANLQKNKNGYGYGELYNYAIGEQGLTEPGSTFKLLSIMALLEEGKINLNDKVETGNGTFKFYDRTMRDVKHGGYGEITIREAFEKSSNVGISRLVEQHFGVTPSKFLDYVEKAGINMPIDFQLKGEGVPYFKKPGSKNWYGTTLPWMSIGYEVKLTPLHTLMLYNAVANNGRMVKPMIVQQISRANVVEQEFKTEVMRKKIASDKTIKELQSLLEGVVENGTAKNIRNADYKIAGKTGTAQKLIDGRYTQKYYASFAGYFPADNPKYSAIVVIDSPKGFNAYGGDVSAPVFKDIADKIFAQDLSLNTKKYKNLVEVDQNQFPMIQAGLAEELQMICSKFGLTNKYEGGERWVKSSVANSAIYWAPNKVDEPIVPDVTGMSLRDALYVLENKGLRVQYSGKGRVKSQSLLAGGNVPTNGIIKLTLG